MPNTIVTLPGIKESIYSEQQYILGSLAAPTGLMYYQLS